MERRNLRTPQWMRYGHMVSSRMLSLHARKTCQLPSAVRSCSWDALGLVTVRFANETPEERRGCGRGAMKLLSLVTPAL